MSDLLKKATKYAESIKADDAYHISKAEFENYAKTDFQAGYICCQQEYEEKLRWIPVEEFKFIIKDSDNPDIIICKEDNRYSIIEITDLYSINYVKNNFSHCRYFL